MRANGLNNYPDDGWTEGRTVPDLNIHSCIGNIDVMRIKNGSCNVQKKLQDTKLVKAGANKSSQKRKNA